MELNQLLKLVKPEWHKAFLRFIDTGEAEDPFMNYINADNQGQKAVEMAFDAQAKAFEGLAKELSSDNTGGVPVPQPVAAGVSGDMARVVRDVLVLEPQVRQEVLQEAASALEASISPKQKRELEGVAEQIGKALSTAASS